MGENTIYDAVYLEDEWQLSGEIEYVGKDLCEVHGWERVCVQGGSWKGCEVVKEILGFDTLCA